MNGARATSHDPLGVELERRALHAARRYYAELNASLFRDKLVPAVLEFSDVDGRFGRYVASTRSIELSRRLLSDHGWGVLVEVLKHEMAHQFVYEVLGVHDEAAHGPAFRKACAERGIDARASGVPEPTGPRHHVLDRIAKLLALAESSNEHEAQAAASAAQRLMLKYNIDCAARGEAQNYRFRHLGLPKGRILESERILATILGHHFFVEVIWVPVYRPLAGKRGTVLEVCGSEENLELAEYVHAFLSHTSERLFREYQKREGIRSRRSRQSFLSGVMTGFRERLEREGRSHSGEGLVWKGDAELVSYFRRRHPHIRFTRHASRSNGHAYAQGREAGKNLVLHRGVSAGPSNTGPRLLPGRR
jgi:hypothetical protein